MQKLEIILEEIRNSGITAVELFGREVPFVAMSEVERIILKHIHTEEILITEMCPRCGKETGISWDVNQDGYQVFCPNCGKPMMLCSMCDRLPCDWTEKGCKYSDDRYCANGGWIPVAEQIPEDGTYLCTFHGELCGLEKPFTGMCGIENGVWDEEGYVMAWMLLPEPYDGEMLE